MATARRVDEWDRAASIVAKLHNVNCTKERDMVRDLSTLNPYRARTRRRSTMTAKEKMAMFKTIALNGAR
jgi:hypothetical protein